MSFYINRYTLIFVSKLSYMYRVTGNIWIEREGNAFIGFGRIILLENVKKYGSITLAAKAMKMSYRQAWELINSMNRQSEKVLIKTASGGKGGGGSELTKEGERIISLYRRLQKKFDEMYKKETNKLNLTFFNTVIQ